MEEEGGREGGRIENGETHATPREGQCRSRSCSIKESVVCFYFWF